MEIFARVSIASRWPLHDNNFPVEGIWMTRQEREILGYLEIFVMIRLVKCAYGFCVQNLPIYEEK